jgi:hypothetical protein
MNFREYLKITKKIVNVIICGISQTLLESTDKQLINIIPNTTTISWIFSFYLNGFKLNMRIIKKIKRKMCFAISWVFCVLVEVSLILIKEK